MIIRDRAWAGGFLEGEGSFGYYKNGKQNGKQSYVLMIQAAQVNSEPLEKLHDLFGGRIYPATNNNGNLIYRWVATGEVAAAVMETVFEFLSTQRQDQVSSALESWGRRFQS